MKNYYQEQKVLIVDDEPANIRILIETLKDSYKLIGATNGKDALECAMSEDPPDLILLDIIMPDMNGHEVCRRLKADKKTRDIPVIFITVMGEDVNETRGFELGAVDYITKPFSLATVKARIQTQMELKSHRDRLERILHERTEKLSNSTRKLEEVSYERMQAEEERVRLITAIEQAGEVFIITDPGGVIQYVNPEFESQTGYSREEAMGRNISILENGESEDAFYKNIWEDIREGNTWRGIFTNKRKNGSLYKAESVISPVFDTEGNIINFVTVSRDVTRELELEAHLRRAQKLEALGTLAGGIAHDFNNIICAMIGYSELAMFNTPRDSQTFQYLERIDEGGRRAADLIRQILTFGQKGERERQSMRIQPVLKEALKLLRGTIPSTIKILHSIDETCKPVLADPSQIYQVIMNLCTNAYHAMRDQGGPSQLEVKLNSGPLPVVSGPLSVVSSPLSVVSGPLPSTVSGEKQPTTDNQRPTIDNRQSTTDNQQPTTNNRQPTTDNYVQLTVKDNGHGMDEETLSKIFDPYFTTKKIGEGTGLGLSSVYGIVQECGGEITVDSKPGHGTVFNIFFPVHTTDDNIRSETDGRAELPSANPSNRYILVVDDEEPIARMIEMKLNRLGYHTKAYTAVTDVLEVFRSSPERFDLVIADMTMPELTGIQLAEEMFRIRPDIPFLLCSGFSENIIKEQARVIGIQNFLKKPFIDGELEKAVHRITAN